MIIQRADPLDTIRLVGYPTRMTSTAAILKWLIRSVIGRPRNYVVLYGAREINFPPNCNPPHYDWVSWLRRSGHIPANSEIHTGGLRSSLRLADAYFFLPQHIARRPWWTYVAGALGSRICMVFYSHNFKADFREGGSYGIAYKGARWPEAIVLTPQCEQALREAGANIGRCIVDPTVSVVDGGGRADLPRETLVAICDMDPDPTRPYLYHSQQVVLDFLDQVSTAVVAAGARPVWKPKGALRQEDSYVPGDVRADGERYLGIARKHNAIIIPANVPVASLVEEVDCAIILPFTSCATTFAAAGRDVVYYDPTGKLGSENLAARGCPIVTSPKALKDWVTNALKMPNVGTS